MPYASKVASAVLRDGFDPRALAEMKTLGSFSQGSAIFRILAAQKVRAEDAALAIRLASNLYQSRRHMAAAQGWPLKHERPGPRHEAYFLELLEEAVRSVRFVA